jgi:DNA end-binding protein Ku
MTRAIWSGNLQLALLNVPVKLHKANKDADVHFKNVHAVCHNPINLKKWCGICNKEVVPTELNKAFALAKDKLIEFSEQELEAVAVAESRQIKIERVIEPAEMAIIATDSIYYLQPDKYAEHTYSLLAKALSVKPVILIGRLIMRSKEHLCAISGYEGGLMLRTLHWHDELNPIKPLLEKMEAIPEEELQLATMLLDKYRAPFGHETFRDTYREKVIEMLNKKMKGETITIAEVKEVPKPTIDLMAELRRSLEIPGGVLETPLVKA